MRFDEARETISSQLDFVPRTQRNQAGRQVAVFAALIAGILLVCYVPFLQSHRAAYWLLAVLAAAAGFHLVTHYQRNLDLVMNTEFQNLLFTQGLSLGCTFCLFVRRDSTIVYASDGMYRLLGSNTAESQMLDAVFERGGIPQADRERIVSAIYSNSKESLIFSIPEVTDRGKKYVMTVEPLARPRGHALVRVRPFQEKRQGHEEAAKPSLSHEYEQLLADTPVALYSTDADGVFTYVNPTFASLLGYGAREVVGLKLSLSQVLATLGERVVGSSYTLDDFIGAASFKTRGGDLSSGVLFQHVQRDDKSKILSANGSLIPMNLKSSAA